MRKTDNAAVSRGLPDAPETWWATDKDVEAPVHCGIPAAGTGLGEYFCGLGGKGVLQGEAGKSSLNSASYAVQTGVCHNCDIHTGGTGLQQRRGRTP